MVANHRQYGAFGAITAESDPSVKFLYAYTGRDWDEDVELSYHRARWYDPSARAWLSEDPISFTAGDANLSRYVGNSSTNFVDPDGHLSKRILTMSPRAMRARGVSQKTVDYPDQ